MIEKVKEQVYELLKKDDSGHGINHINKVLNLSLKFATEENANTEIVALIALLHDVDDYKLFGKENADKLYNAKKIMDHAKVNQNIQDIVIDELNNFGYSKLLKGKRPKTLEGQIVSDADMCDSIGINGILRIFTYTTKHNKPFFDKNIFPIDDMTSNKYNRICSESSVCHIFEKVLKLKKLIFTKAGKIEIEKRHKITIEILYQLFEEENAPEWTKYLDDYLEKHYKERN